MEKEKEQKIKSENPEWIKEIGKMINLNEKEENKSPQSTYNEKKEN